MKYEISPLESTAWICVVSFKCPENRKHCNQNQHLALFLASHIDCVFSMQMWSNVNLILKSVFHFSQEFDSQEFLIGLWKGLWVRAQHHGFSRVFLTFIVWRPWKETQRKYSRQEQIVAIVVIVVIAKGSKIQIWSLWWEKRLNYSSHVAISPQRNVLVLAIQDVGNKVSDDAVN